MLVKKILSVTKFLGPDQFILRLREVQLPSGVKPWLDARIDLESIRFDHIVPPQRYVLADRLEEHRFFEEHWQDILPTASSPMMHYTVQYIDDSEASFYQILPIVEADMELPYDEFILADGMHRAYLRRSTGAYGMGFVRIAPLNLKDNPYYASPYTMDGRKMTWTDVQTLPAPPPSGSDRKNYRQPGNHKALFRLLDAQFPGMQTPRVAPSEPVPVVPTVPTLPAIGEITGA